MSQHGFRAFTEYDLGANLDHFLSNLRKEIEADSSAVNASEEDYLKQKVAEKTLSSIKLDIENISVTQEEREIPSRYFPNTFMVDEGRSYPKPVITFHLPFTGDEQLLHCRPSTMLMVSEEIAVENGYIIFDLINFSNNPEQIAKERDQIVKHLVEMAGYVNRDVEGYNSRLESAVRDAFHAAQKKHTDQSDFLSKLGNKVKDS